MLSKTFNSIINEYYSCAYIEETIVFKYDSISFCCFPNKDVEMTLPAARCGVSETSRNEASFGAKRFNLGVDESEIAEFVEFKESIRARNHTDNALNSCKACGYFCKKNWPTTKYHFNNLIIFNVYTCHLLCNYCFRAYPDYKEPSPVQKYKLYNKIKYLIDNKYLSPLAGIDWSGGEPTLNQEFDDIVRLFNDYGTFVQRFATNGIVLSPAIIETLKLGRSGIVCSVDAGTAETYKLIKGKDYFEQVWFNLKEYAKTGGDVRVKYIILNENINEIFQFINKVQEAGIDKIIYSINGMQACDAKYVDKVIRTIVELVDECDKRNINVTAAPIIDCCSNVKSRIDSALLARESIMTYDISIIVTAHHEGRLVHKTMKSIFKALGYAKSHGITSQIIVVLDKPNEETAEYFSSNYNSDVTVKTVDYGDPGLSRNHGVSIASGKYIALLDGDDLFTEEWLVKAYNEAVKHNEDIVWYPEYVISFGCHDMIAKYKGTRENTFNVSDLIENNCWNSVHFMTKKEVLLAYPFVQTQLSLGFGYEDWHWYCEIIAQFIEIRIVPETLVYYRKKKVDSRLSQFIQMMVLMPPSKLFEVDTFSKYVSERQLDVTEESTHEIASAQRAWLRRFKRFVDLTYFALSPVVTPFFQKYPKIHQLARKLAGITINNNSARHFPEWLLTAWEKIHEIEPQLYPERWIIETIQYYDVPQSRIGLDYINLCRQYIDPPSHLFILPWIVRGGADLEVLNYIHALAKDSLAKQITVITTENIDSPWAARLPEGVRFIEFGRQYAHLTPHEKEILLTRVLIQMPPQVIHNVNSPLCYWIFIKYAKALRNRSRLFVSTFCKDVSEDGRAVGYPFMYLPQCFDDLEAVFCDNKSFIDSLCDIYAYEKQKFHVHYQPFTITERKKYYDRVPEKKTIDILWAGRMDRQKRPDILAAIAEACQNMPFHFHVYGAALLDRDIYSGRMKELKNVTLYGLFDGLQSLPVELYDLFLYTSQWDGLPNVLLEAISVGLPIIASNVGGVSELIVSGETGYLIEPYDDVNAYVQCLRDIYKDRSLLPVIVDNAYDIVSAKHSWEGFLSNIKNCPGYIAN